MHRAPPQKGGGWRLVPYILPSGRCPVFDEFFDQLRRTNLKRFVEYRDIWKPEFEKHGPLVGPPHWEPLRGGLFEIRWGRCRIYCSPESERRIVMYMGVVKRWPKFTNRDRRACEERRAEFLSPVYDQDERERAYLALRKERANNGLV